MSNAVSGIDEVFLAAQALAPQEKLQLISRIWETIPPSSFRPNYRALEEVKRRWTEFESGNMDARPWEEVRDSVRRRLGLHE